VSVLPRTQVSVPPPAPPPAAAEARPRVLLVGNPNVGKSALFNRLTGRYVTVSNYPGTTVEVARGRSKAGSGRFEIVDTPGMYSLAAIGEEERVAARLLLSERAHAVLHVIDAKNIERMLGLTLQLIEAGLPVILVLNMADEARHLGIKIDAEVLARRLGVPVAATVATRGKGVAELMALVETVRAAEAPVEYDPPLEQAIAALAGELTDLDTLSARTRALLLLQDSRDEMLQLAGRLGRRRAGQLLERSEQLRRALPHSVHYHVALATRRAAQRILTQAAEFPEHDVVLWRERLSRLCMHPIAGIPLLLAVLYFGLYRFVGRFGAGTLVDLLEHRLFDDLLNPIFRRAADAVLPWPIVRELFVGDYGVLTQALRYAVAIVLPIVGTFFLAFSILEDSGYLPRLAMLLDRLFKRIGLNGRAVIPMVLGFGCDSMATLVTRTLETPRERVIAAFLLALAVPCSAQLGVILGLLAAHPLGLVVWAGVIGGVFLAAGFLASRLLPGPGPSFYMELPPLRLPRPANMLIKTYSRMVWYFREVLPLFLLASVLIWLGKITGGFGAALAAMKPLVRLIGLPQEAAVALLFGFFRRDYGAAGLYDLQHAGSLSGTQLTVAAITLTLFLPCLAQFLIMKKERGWRMALLTSAIALATAFAAGFLVNGVINMLGAKL
jgi:ferrous iron transport protein B